MELKTASKSITQYHQEVTDAQINGAIDWWKNNNPDNCLVEYSISESVFTVGGKPQFRVRVFFKYHSFENPQPQA